MIKKYLFLPFSSLFFSLFLVLFFISSIIMLISIASVTAVIKLSFLDLGIIYLYMMPTSVYFIIPIVFFAAAVLTISKLSFEYEMLSLFALGLAPRALIKAFFPLTLLVTLVLLLFSLAVTPLTKSAYSNFKDMKKSSIDINVRAGQLGQKIGDYLLYVTKKLGPNEYEGLVLLSTKEGEGQSFIIAKHGYIKNSHGIFSLFLNDGSAYMAKDEIVRKIAFKDLVVRNKITHPKLDSYSLKAYWGRAFTGSNSMQKRLIKALMLSCFPLASLFFIPLLGINNPRFNKNITSLYVLGFIVVYYLLMQLALELRPYIGVWQSVAIPCLVFVAGYLLYRAKITSKY